MNISRKVFIRHKIFLIEGWALAWHGVNSSQNIAATLAAGADVQEVFPTLMHLLVLGIFYYFLAWLVTVVSRARSEGELAPRVS